MQCQVAVQVTESGVQVWRQCTGECDADTWDRYKKNNAGKVKKASDGKRCVAPVCKEHRKIMKDSRGSTGLFWWSSADALGAPEMLESRVTLARAEQVKPIPFSIRAHSARASLGLPKIAYLSASSISAAAVAISLPLCNLSKLIAT